MCCLYTNIYINYMKSLSVTSFGSTKALAIHHPLRPDFQGLFQDPGRVSHKWRSQMGTGQSPMQKDSVVGPQDMA